MRKKATLLIVVLTELVLYAWGETCVHHGSPVTIYPTTKQRSAGKVRVAFSSASYTSSNAVPLNITFISASFCYPCVNMCGASQPSQQIGTLLTSTVVPCTPSDVFTTAKAAYVEALLSDAKQYLSSSVNLRGPMNPIASVPAATCTSDPGSVELPSPFPSTSVDLTLATAIVWTAVPLDPSYGDPTATVWGEACQVDGTTGRVTLAHVNFVPGALENAEEQDALAYQNDLDALLHVMIHLLGFSMTAFSYRGYYNLDGTFSNGTAISTVYSASLGKNVTMVITPRVVQAVQLFTGCSSLMGAEIDANDTTVLHWKMPLFLQDLMTVKRGTVLRFASNITLSFLEDTGLYVRVDGPTPWALDMQRIRFGAGWGCSFVNELCNYNFSQGIPTQGFAFTPLNSNLQQCTFDLLARGYGDAQTFDNNTVVPVQYRYYGSDVNGGGALGPEMDYCPIIVPFNNGACIDAANRDALNIFGNIYGPSSRCFNSDAISLGFVASSPTRCFEVVCATMSYGLRVQGFEPILSCPYDGGSLTLPANTGLQGTVQCPPFNVLCSGNSTDPLISDTSIDFVGVWPPQTPDVMTLSEELNTTEPIPFSTAEPCEFRLDSCFIPALDALWGSGQCGRIALALQMCFGGDCIDERNTILMENAVVLNTTGRTVIMFGANCSSGAEWLAANCNNSSPVDILSYCSLQVQPSAAAPLRVVSVLYVFAMCALVFAAL